MNEWFNKYLFNEFIGVELTPDHQDKVLNDVLWTVNIQETSNDDWQTGGVNLLYVDLYK